jgi:hypothetical protein
MNDLKKIISVGIFSLVSLLSGCFQSPQPDFNWPKYAEGFKNFSNRNKKSPAIYGFGGFLGNNVNRTIDSIVKDIKVSDYASPDLGKWPQLMNRIREHYENGSPIILIGHSAGCSDAVNVANILEKAGVPVSIIFLDAAYLKLGLFKPQVGGIKDSYLIPRNVYRVENYISRGPFNGREIKGSDFKDNNKAGTRFLDFYLKTNHWEMANGEFTNYYIASINRILEDYKEIERKN